MFSFIKNLLPSPKKTIIPKSSLIPRNEHPISQGDISHNALKVVNHLSKNRQQAFLVGGSIRDLFLHKKPKDFDVATSATPEQVKKLFKNCRLIGRRFKLAHVYFRKEIIEVATFRSGAKEETQKNLRNSSGMISQDNVFGTLSTDVWRRDFTINALYYCPKRHAIIDYTGGVDDLKNKVIRIIGTPSLRFSEDPVRILRAIRFAATLDFSIEQNTKDAILDCAHLIKDTSNSRLFEEIIKLFHSGAGLKVFKLLIELKVFSHLFPQVAPHLSNPKCQKLIEQTLRNTDKRIKRKKPVTPAFIYAVLLWFPMLAVAKKHQNNRVNKLKSYEMAIIEVFSEQNKLTHVPKRFSQYIKEMWFLQPRFNKRQGQRPFRLLTHPRFRAAYDLYALRAEAKDANQTIVDWWTEFQFADSEHQQSMISEL